MRLLAPVLLIGAAACTALPPASAEGGTSETVPVQGETATPCDAAPAQHLIGRQRSAELGAEAMRLSRAKALRWIPPGTMVTMDFREDRLNIDLDGAGKVTRIRCG